MQQKEQHGNHKKIIMIHDENNAAMDAFYDDIREELYPEIINEFISDKLQLHFISNPDSAKPAYLALKETIRHQEQ